MPSRSSVPFLAQPLSLAIGTLLLSNAALAEPVEQADTMVVTASRSEQASTEVPLSIGVINAGQLELDQGAHIEDSVNAVAGATLNQLSGSSSHNTGIRLPLNYDGYYLFLQDGIPLQSAAFFNHNGLRWASYNTSADQIEILKGAGTTLYGAGAVAATINVRSADPAFEPESKIKLLAGENDYGQLQFSHTDAIADDQAILIAASALQDGGWRDHTRRERQELLLKHLWQGEESEIKTVLQLSQLEDESASGLTQAQYDRGTTQTGLSDQVLATDPQRSSDFIRLSMEWSYSASDQLEISMIPYLRHSTNNYVATWRSYTPVGETAINTIGLLNKASYQHNDGSETFFGLDLEQSQSDELSFQPFTVTTSGWGANTYVAGHKYRDQEVQYRNLSPYVQHNRFLSDNLQLQAGLRYDYNRYELENNLAETDNDGYGNRRLADRSDSFSSLNPKLAASYRLSDSSNLYGRIAQATRLPSASTLYNLSSGDSKSLAGGVDEERSTTWELGYKMTSDQLDLTLAAYRMEIKDAIVRAEDSKGDSFSTNAGETRHQGVELELLYRFAQNWSLQAALSESRHKFIDYINDGTDFSGKEMMRAPHSKGSLALNWAPGPLQTQLQLEHFGTYWMDDANTQKAPSFTLLNLKARYNIAPDWQLFARIDNLLDRRYSHQTEIRYGKVRYYPGQGLNVKAGLEYRW